MSGALKVGDVFVAVSASLGEFSKSMDRLLKDIEEAADGIAKSMQEAADAVSGFSENLLGFAAIAGAAVAAAAERYEDASNATEALKNSTLQLSAEVGRAFLPVVREMERGVRTVTATWRGLSAETKASIVAMVRHAAIIGSVGMALSRLLLVGKATAEGVMILTKATRAVGPALTSHLADIAKGVGASLTGFRAFMKMPLSAHLTNVSDGLKAMRKSVAQLPGMAKQLMSSFRSMIPQVAAVAGPILAVAAAAAALAFLAGVIYDAWTDTSTGLRDAVTSAGQAVLDLVKRVQTSLLAMFRGAIDVAKDLLGFFVEGFVEKIRSIAKWMEGVAHRIGAVELAKNMAAIQNLSSSGIASFIDDFVEKKIASIEKTFNAVLESVSSVGGTAVDAVKYAAKRGAIGWEKMWNDSPLPKLLAKAEAMLRGAAPTIGDPDSVHPDEDERHLETDPKLVGGPDKGMERYRQRILGWGRDGIYTVQKAIADAIREHARAARESAKQVMKEEFGGRLRDVVTPAINAVQTFVTGLTASGGNLLGGLGAVLTDMLTKSEGFTTLMGMVSNLFQRAADILGALLTPLQGLLGAISMVLDGVLRPLTPLFGMVASVLAPLTPALVVLGDALAAVAPVFTILTQIVLAVLQPIQLLAGPAMTGLWYALKGVAFIIMAVAWAIGTAWNGIVSAVQWVFRSIGELEIGSWRPFEALSEWADSMESAKAPVDELEQSMANLRDMSIEEAQAKANATAEQLKNTQAVKEATEALTNVPPAWRFARNKYLSQDAQSGPGGGTPAPAPANTAPSAPAPAPTTQAQSAQQAVTVEQVYNLVMQGDLKTALEQAKRLQRDAAFRLGRALPGLFVGGV